MHKYWITNNNKLYCTKQVHPEASQLASRRGDGIPSPSHSYTVQCAQSSTSSHTQMYVNTYSETHIVVYAIRHAA